MVAMQACYVNTTHPDFLNGHKVGLRHTFVPFYRPFFEGHGDRHRALECE